jgi:hypothetical protein
MVNLHLLILQHFQMLFLELMEYIFHSPKHKMIVDYLIILYKIDFSHLMTTNLQNIFKQKKKIFFL